MAWEIVFLRWAKSTLFFNYGAVKSSIFNRYDGSPRAFQFSEQGDLMKLSPASRIAVLVLLIGFTLACGKQTGVPGDDSASADDIVQETFIRAWRHLPKLTADSRLVRPWLFRVAPQPADRCRPTATASRREATGEGAATEGTDDLAVSA